MTGETKADAARITRTEQIESRSGLRLVRPGTPAGHHDLLCLLPGDRRYRRFTRSERRGKNAGPGRVAQLDPSRSAGEDALAAQVRALMAKYALAPAMLEEIIAGVEMDLRIVALRHLCRPASLLLPRRERGRIGQHRDLWLSQSAVPGVRDRARARVANHQHHPRCRQRSAERSHLPAAG